MLNKDQKHTQLLQLIEHAQISLAEARAIAGQFVSGDGEAHLSHATEFSSQSGMANSLDPLRSSSPRVMEGVFDGQGMVGNDGKAYSVPSNYASKSKLVEGDQLKLTIQPDGSFVYKQVGPIDRKRVKGILHRDADTDQFRVLAEGKSYRILTASVTYFKGNVGDEVVLLLPREKTSLWGAVENIISRSALPLTASENGQAVPAFPASGVEPFSQPKDQGEPAGRDSFSV